MHAASSSLFIVLGVVIDLLGAKVRKKSENDPTKVFRFHSFLLQDRKAGKHARRIFARQTFMR
jgi:hypothetical protein